MASSKLLFALPSILLSLSLVACGQEGTGPSSASSSSGSSSSGSGGGGAGDPGVPVKILNYNTHNFFDTLEDPATDDTVLTQTQYSQKRSVIGAVLHDLDPDIAVLPEIETTSILADLDQQVLNGAYPNRIILESNDQRGVDVGVLSKIPADKVVSHKGDMFTKAGTNGPVYTYSRDCLELHFTVNGKELIVLAVHYRSKGPPDDSDKRLAEAQHTRSIADALQTASPEALILILGDFNDTPGSQPVLAVEGADPNKYVDSANAVPSAQRYTYVYMGTLELIDHQMASPKLAALLDPASVVIPHGAGIDDDKNGSSDHAPIMATYGIK